ncbi:MAG: leucine-rich repeat domain-containing protein, partial [Bacilli bacterium]|nr:leucine-rich repeat domain-containing protein [Bacilli bacterium]
SNLTSEKKTILLDIAKAIVETIVPVKSIKMSEGITDISNGFFSGLGQADLIFPSTITRIRQSAFASSSIAVKLNEGLETIEEDAFEEYKANSINFPNSLKDISYHAFDNSKLKSVIIPQNASVWANAFKDCSELTTVIWNSTSGLSAGVFANNSKLTTVIINTEIPWIQNGAFDDLNVNPNLVLNFKMSEDKKDNIVHTGFDYANYNIVWGYTE